jgi:hypothetical protein
LITLDSQYNLEDLEYTLTEVPDHQSKGSSGGAQDKGMQGRRLRPGGLANIGSQLLMANQFGEELMDMDEDDHVVEIVNSLECAQMTIKATPKVPGVKEKAKPGSSFAPTRVIFNLSEFSNKPMEEYLNLGDWIHSQKLSLQTPSPNQL